MSDIKSIKFISDSSLCCACGACETVCPTGAITMNFLPSGFLCSNVNSLCISCGKCLKVCPSYIKNASSVLRNMDLLKKTPVSIFGLIAHSTDSNIRYHGQSGGVVTSLLKWLLETGCIEGAVVNRFDEALQKNVTIISDRVEDITAASGSNYIQSSTLSELGCRKFETLAIVCTGCQSQALHLMENNLHYEHPYIVIGLVCEGCYNREMFFDLTKERLSLGSIREFRFRDKRNGGWPGGVYIRYLNGRVIKKSIASRANLKKYYTTYRCLQCFDMNNNYADIVVGDPWCFYKSINKNELKKGETVVIARTEKGASLLLKAQQENVIDAKEIEPELFFSWNSFREGRTEKTIIANMFCDENRLPCIYNNDDYTVIKNHLPYDRMEINKKDVERQVLFSYQVYNCQSEDRFKKLIQDQKKRDRWVRLFTKPKMFIKNIIVCLKSKFF